MDGLHMVSDMSGCSGPAMVSAEELERECLGICKEAGLTVVASAFHQFPSHGGMPGGATGAVVLAESHLTVHTWPESGHAAVDAYVCNHTMDNSGKARMVVDRVAGALGARGRVDREVVRRGVGDAVDR